MRRHAVSVLISFPFRHLPKALQKKHSSGSPEDSYPNFYSYTVIEFINRKEVIKMVRLHRNPGKTLRGVYDQRFNTPRFPEENKRVFEWKIPLMEDVAQRLRKAFNDGDFIQVVADYDCDGVCSAAILHLIFEYYEYSNVDIRFPKRMSEGYGLSDIIVDEILEKPMGLCILIDNGISAVEQVKKLRNWGWEVIILDHHQLRDDKLIPAANIVVDPSAIKGQAAFPHYCGAGLGYKLAEVMCAQNFILLDKIKSLAAVATIADLVLLVDPETKTYDNWIIVRQGMRAMLRPGRQTQGLYCLMRAMNCINNITATDLGFSIAPCINAVGRLYDDGAKTAYELLISDNNEMSKYDELANFLKDTNNTRKSIQKDAIDKIGSPDTSRNLIILETDVTEGILGIIAGHAANKYHVPAIVFAKTPDGYKGSMRAPNSPEWDSFDVKEMLDQISDDIVKYGGHKGAAGLTVAESCFEKFCEDAYGILETYSPEEPVLYYDAEISTNEIARTIEILEQYEPHGLGNPRPIFKIADADVVPAGRAHVPFEIRGADQQTLTLHLADKVDAVSFRGVGKKLYFDAGAPNRVTLFGTISKNTWGKNEISQVVFDDLLA